jgi:hypothetical protein
MKKIYNLLFNYMKNYLKSIEIKMEPKKHKEHITY